jgi:uncharacterized RmlC-like cupin family protein
MGHGQVLRVIKTGRWLNRQHADPARPGLSNPGSGVIIRPSANLPGASPEGLPGGQPDVRLAGYRDCRRSGRDRYPDVSGPSSGDRALRLHLVMIPPGTRGRPHRHDRHQLAVYLVSGAAELWHGPGFAQSSTVGAGDYIGVPPGTPHLLVNRGDVTAIAVVTRTGTGNADNVPVELPGRLAELLSLPVGSE